MAGLLRLMTVAMSWPRAIMRGVIRTNCISAPDMREGVITCSTRRGDRHWESGVGMSWTASDGAAN